MSVEPIESPYLIVVGIPYYVDAAGTVKTDALWHWDLVRHFEYLPNLMIAAPLVQYSFDVEGWTPLTEEESKRCRFIPLPPQNSFASSVVLLPKTIVALWKAIGNAAIVHTGPAGWPFPLSAIANPLARLRRRKLVVLIESAPWRPNPGDNPSLRQRIRTLLHEYSARWGANHADVVVATHQAYLTTLATRPRGRVAVASASWIKEESIRSDEDAANDWRARIKKPLRFIFAARLNAEKGTDVVLDAVRGLAARGADVSITIVGSGVMRDACEKLGQELPEHLRILEPVEYGEEFFALLREYHGIIVPTLSDEQPRVIFDAYSQALPIIASDTQANREFVHQGSTGWLVPAGNAEKLVDCLLHLREDLGQLQACGMHALGIARANTHRKMHDTRAELLRLSLV